MRRKHMIVYYECCAWCPGLTTEIQASNALFPDLYPM